MKEFIGLILQITFIGIGLGISFLLLYFGFISPRKKKADDPDQQSMEMKGKFIG